MYGVGNLAKCTSSGKATADDILAINKIVRKVWYSKSVRLLLRGFNLYDDKNRTQLIGYTDASHCRLKDLPARVGFMFWVAPVPESSQTYGLDVLSRVDCAEAPALVPANPVLWKSKDVGRKVSSILDAELISAQWGSNLGLYLQSLYVEMGLVSPGTPVLILNDNKSNVSHIRSTNRHTNPRLQALWAVLRENYDKGKISLRWLCGQTKNVSDVLTTGKSNLTRLMLRYLLKGQIEVPA